MNAAVTLGQEVGVVTACAALGVSRAGFYRARHDPAPRSAERPRSPLALPEPLEREILGVLHSERFMDQSPYQVYAKLLDEGRYLCSIRSFHRILGRRGEVRERRNQARRPAYAKPELIAIRPNQVWSWDITKLKGPTPGVHFHLYLIIDLFSRCVVGWTIAERESTELAKRLIDQTCLRQGVQRGQLTIHADRGSSKGKPPVHPPLPTAAWINPPNPLSQQENTPTNDSPELH